MGATKKPFVMTPTHENILAALNRYYVMHAKQINRLLFGKRSDDRMYGMCLALADNGYIEQEHVARQKRGGGQYTANMLSGKGRRFLKRRGYEVAPRVRRTESPDSNPFFRHTFAVNEVLIRAEQLAKQHEEIILDSLLHEHTIKREYGLQVTIPPQSRTYTARVDGFVQFAVNDGSALRHHGFALEVDRDTTKDKNDFKKKIYALIMAKRLRLFDQAFGAPMRVMITTPSNKRMNTLMSWTSEALITMAGEPDESARFFFTDQPVDDAMTADDLFLSPLWYQFDTDERVPLFAIAETPVPRHTSRLPNERGGEHHDHR